MMLNQCTKDFQSLIDKLELLRAYENADENNRSEFYSVLSNWQSGVSKLTFTNCRTHTS